MIPGYTHVRRAQAVLWPHYILAYFEMFARDYERWAKRVRGERDAARVGSAGRKRLSVRSRGHRQELGFASITRNSMDVSGDRDFVLDFLYAASTTMLHLSRLAEDWILYSGEEYRWIELGDGVTSGSSLMPQKKNPDSLELIRGKCGRVYGALTSLFVTMKGLPMTYNRDMQEDKEPLFDAADQLRGSLQMARVVAESVSLNAEVPAAAAAEKLGCRDGPCGGARAARVPVPSAHQIVGRLVLESVRAAKSPGDWTSAELTAFAPEFTPEMATLFEPAQGMKTANRSRRDCTGLRCSGAEGRGDSSQGHGVNKTFRQGQILRLIKAGRVHTQEQLAQALARSVSPRHR